MVKNEKEHQVEPSSIRAFGIKLDSRYGNAAELSQMLKFACLANSFDVARYIREVFFDSKVGLATFYWSMPEANIPIWAVELILHSARKSLLQFEIHGRVFQLKENEI